MQARAADEFDRRCRAACLSLRVALTLPATFVVENVLTGQINAVRGHQFQTVARSRPRRGEQGSGVLPESGRRSACRLI